MLAGIVLNLLERPPMCCERGPLSAHGTGRFLVTDDTDRPHGSMSTPCDGTAAVQFVHDGRRLRSHVGSSSRDCVLAQVRRETGREAESGKTGARWRETRQRRERRRRTSKHGGGLALERRRQNQCAARKRRQDDRERARATCTVQVQHVRWGITITDAIIGRGIRGVLIIGPALLPRAKEL